MMSTEFRPVPNYSALSYSTHWKDIWKFHGAIANVTISTNTVNIADFKPLIVYRTNNKGINQGNIPELQSHSGAQWWLTHSPVLRSWNMSPPVWSCIFHTCQVGKIFPAELTSYKLDQKLSGVLGRGFRMSVSIKETISLKFPKTSSVCLILSTMLPLQSVRR